MSSTTLTNSPSIGFIGGGNMATSLVGGMIESGISADDIIVSEPNQERCEYLHTQFQVQTTQDNTALLECDCVVLAIKPQVLAAVCKHLKLALTGQRPLFISIAAGVLSQNIDRWLGGIEGHHQAIVRCMPNTPALVGCGATGLFANSTVSDSQKQLAEKILSAVGLSVWVSTEAELNAVTAVSGSGPAYYFLMMEAMQAAGEKLGLSTETARKLVLQTALGAAKMASESTLPPATLRQQVTSKGGTTAAALANFEANNYHQIVAEALQAANDRSISLAEELNE